MSRNVLIALVLIALTVIVLLVNGGETVSLNLLVTQLRRVSASMVLLAFTGIGVLIGLLLR